MKELIFVRHAKSDWYNENLRDIDRFLSERGYSDAYALSQWFAKNKNRPDLVLSSTATRALSTALIFCRQMKFDLKRFKLDAEIYESTASNLVTIVQQQDETYNSLMLFGHNPGFTEACNRLSENLLLDNIPTCGIVSLTFDVQLWCEIVYKTGKLNYYQFPKDFKN